MLLMPILAFARFDGRAVCLDIHQHINTALRVLGSFVLGSFAVSGHTASQSHSSLTLHDSRVTPDRSAEPFPTLFSRVWALRHK